MKKAEAVELKRYFEQIVKPTAEEFLQDFPNKTNVRKAALAAIVLVHMADQFGYYEGVDSNDRKLWPPYFEAIKLECPELSTLRECCNFVKHWFLRSDKKKPIQEDAPSMFHAPFGSGCFAEASYVHYDDEQMPFIIRKVLNYWQSKVDALPNCDI